MLLGNEGKFDWADMLNGNNLVYIVLRQMVVPFYICISFYSFLG